MKDRDSIIVLAALALLLAGCGTTSMVRPAPATLDVTHNYYVPIPADMTAHGEVPKPTNKSEDELINVAKLRGHDLVGCFIKLDAIGGIQGLPVPEATK